MKVSPSARATHTTKKKCAVKTTEQQVERAAEEIFGIENFRPGQAELISAALAGRDSIGVMPTGSGKSLCFQLPSLLLPKTVVVVSPLISLMQDQHHKLIDLGIPSAKCNSTNTAAEEQDIKISVADGEKDLVYVTPERLENAEYLHVLREAGVSLFVVDEAHCISQWGHDFRPAYTALASAIKTLGRPPIMALTATATDDVTRDIVSQLQLKEPILVRRGIDRPNLIFSVVNTMNDNMKQERLLAEIQSAHGVALVYVATVKAAEQVAEWLCSQNIRAAAYHGKLAAKKRQQIQEDFMSDRYNAIVATKAFGMGIDKIDVRLVVHYQFPDSVESYYQEAGRAGRDGNEARAILLYQLEDKRIQSYFLGGKYPNRQEVTTFLDALEQASQGQSSVNLQKLSEVSDVPIKKLRVIANYLESAELIAKTRGIKALRAFSSGEELEQFLKHYEERHQNDRDRLEQIIHYAQTIKCRIAFLQQYFGENPQNDCGRCDNCQSTPDDIKSAFVLAPGKVT